jgi:hypothetical protein
MVLQEIILLRDGLLRIEFGDDGRYRLAYGDWVVYENGRRIMRGRSAPYDFKSVEQLRYDFERDVAAAGGRLA